MGKNKIAGEVSKAILVILSGYEPVDTMQDATHFFTTQELQESVASHTGRYLTIEDVFNIMEWNHFHYGRQGELSLVWMMKAKS